MITRDTFTSFGIEAPEASHTESFTVSGTDPILLVSVEAFRSGSPASTTSITFDGNALTRLDFVAPIAGMELSFWYLANPPEVTGNVIVNCANTNAGDGFIRGTIFTYKGVKQLAPVEGTPTTDTQGAGVNMVMSVTATVPNCMGVVAMFGSGTEVTNASNWINNHPRPMIFDYLSPTTGITMTLTGGIIGGNGSIIAAFAPSLSPSAPMFFNFLPQ